MEGGRQEELIERILEEEARLHQLSLSAQPHPLLDVELTMSQLKTLFVLACTTEARTAGGPRISDLARELGVTPATASTLVDRLVERGLVERREDPLDRRQHRCQVAPLGQQLLRRIYEVSRLRTRKLLAELSESELETVHTSIELLIRAAERLAGGVSPAPC